MNTFPKIKISVGVTLPPQPLYFYTNNFLYQGSFSIAGDSLTKNGTPSTHTQTLLETICTNAVELNCLFS